MASFDLFVAALQCAACGETSPADTTTNMHTYIRAKPEMASLPVGSAVDVSHENLLNANYWSAQDAGDGPVRLLVPWECPYCGTPGNWAEVTVEDGVIQEIQEVQLTQAALRRAHYVSNEIVDVAAALAGVHSRDIMKTPEKVLAILRERLE